MNNNVETNNSNIKNKILYLIILVIALVACYFSGYFIGLKGSESNDHKTNKDNEIVEENKSEQEEGTSNETGVPEEKPVVVAKDYTPKCDENTREETNLIVDIEDNKYNHIIDYIKEQENVSIDLGYCLDSDPDNYVEYTLNDLEKNNALNEIKQQKQYIEAIELGGGACVPSVEIKYQRNGKQYKVSYWGYVMESNDGNIYKIIDDNHSGSIDKKYCHYLTNGLGSTINSMTEYE